MEVLTIQSIYIMTPEEYKKSLDALKKTKPDSRKPESWKGFNNVGAALNAYNKKLKALKAKNPTKFGFTYSQEKGLSYEKVPNKKVPNKTAPEKQPTATPNKQATVTPANKEATKIANDVKSVAKKNSTPKRAVLKDKVRGSARIGFKTRPGGQRKKK